MTSSSWIGAGKTPKMAIALFFKTKLLNALSTLFFSSTELID
jgi:hypothetical protein